MSETARISQDPLAKHSGVDYHLVARARLVARKHLQITTTTDALVAACASTRILPPEHKNPDRERSQTGGRNNHDDTGILTASARNPRIPTGSEQSTSAPSPCARSIKPDVVGRRSAQAPAKSAWETAAECPS